MASRAGGSEGGTRRWADASADGRPVKLCVMIDADMHKRLSVLAVMTGRTLTEIVVEALRPVASSVRMPSTPRLASFQGGEDSPADAAA